MSLAAQLPEPANPTLLCIAWRRSTWNIVGLEQRMMRYHRARGRRIERVTIPQGWEPDLDTALLLAPHAIIGPGAWQSAFVRWKRELHVSSNLLYPILMTEQETYMQSRCIACGGELYALAVYDYSHGHARCHNCGNLGVPMSKDEYLAKLRARMDEPPHDPLQHHMHAIQPEDHAEPNTDDQP